MAINKGAILLARKTLESDIFFRKPDKWFKIWCTILLLANHSDVKQFKRGEVFTSYEILCSHTKATRNEVDHCIRWLKQARQIATHKATRGLYIRVLNYNIYQSLDNYKSDTRSDTKSVSKAKQAFLKSDTINKYEIPSYKKGMYGAQQNTPLKEAGGEPEVRQRYGEGATHIGASLQRFKIPK